MQANSAADFLEQFSIIAASQSLSPLLDQTRFVFHGVDVRDLPGIEQLGFRWLSGKASFLLDAEYAVRKYATLGRNSRHCYGPRYVQDLAAASTALGASGAGDAAERVQSYWASVGEFTALLVFDRQSLLLRPGVGGTLFAHDRRLLGGLSKWLHFHLGLWNETPQQWAATSAGRFASFLSEQDRRYGSSFTDLLENPTPSAEPAWNHLPTDALRAVVRPDALWRQILRGAASLAEAHSLDVERAFAGQLQDAPSPPASAAEAKEIALAIVRGCRWGQLILAVRKLLVAHARHQGLQCIKIDAPCGHWQPDLLSEDQAREAIRWLAEHPGPCDELYQEYRQSCLNVLQDGSKRLAREPTRPTAFS
jgi:hypothetical protein